MEAVLLYITAANREDAILVCRDLVGARAVACANILEHATSFFWWQGEIEQETEVVIVAKTMASHVDRAVERVKALHTYECPCVVAMPIKGGNPEYIEWIAKEVAASLESPSL